MTGTALKKPLAGKAAVGSLYSFARLFKHSRKHRGDLYWGVFFSFLKKLFDIAPEILIGVAIDVVVNQQKSFLSKLGVTTALNQLALLSVLVLFIWIFESMAEYCYLIKWRGLAQSIQHDFRVEAYEHLQKLDMAYFEDRSTGALVAVLNDDINQLERFFNEGMNSLVQIATSIVLVGGVFFALEPKVAIVAFIPMPLVFLAAFYFQKKAGPLYGDVREKAGLLSTRLTNDISGIATIRSFTAEMHEAQRIRHDSQNYVDANRVAIKVAARFNPMARMGVLLGFLGTFIVGGALALHGQLNVGAYGVLVFLSQRLLWPLRDLAVTVDLFERAMASADRVLELLEVPVFLELPQKYLPLPKEMHIEFKGLSFSYKNKVPVLKSIDLQIASGKTVAIVGPTGSGKSTVTKLLLRFYQTEHGAIKVGGINIEDYDPRHLRSQIGLVSQDVFLFDGTIYENILYGNPEATREQVVSAARKAYADEFIDRLPQGLETKIGERGQKLSGGQRQRISIARVILKNPPILIFDEATSAVDNETEALIQKSLDEISKLRTTIVIAHRLSTVVHADWIYVLDQGQVQEQGTHADLLKKKQVYSQLWNRQIRESAYIS